MMMVTAIFATATLTNTLAQPIPAGVLDRWGFGLRQVQDGRFYQLFLAPFQVLRPYMAVSITATILLFVGTCEYQLGSRRTIISFLVSHVAGYTGALLVLRVGHELGWAWAGQTMHVTDVGASNGAFGAAGTAVLFLPRRVRNWTIGILSAFLVIVLIADRREWDIEHMLAFGTGIAIGSGYLWRAQRYSVRSHRTWILEHRQRPWFISWAVRMIGVVNVLGAFLIPHYAGFARLESWIPVGSPYWPRHLLLLSGLFLILLSPGLARAQRMAWFGAVAALVVSLALQLHVGITPFESIVSASFLLFIVAWRKDFRAPSHPPALRSGVRFLTVLMLAMPLYGLVGFLVLRSQFDTPVHFSGAIVTTFQRMFFATTDNISTGGHIADWFLRSIPLVTWVGVAYALSQMIRSVLAPRATATDHDDAKDLLKQHGTNSTSYMTLWNGNSLFLEPNRRGYLAYRVNDAVAVVLGDPIGDPDARYRTIRTFTHYASERGWSPVFYAATAQHMKDYRQLGYDILRIGEEAVIDLPRLEFRGKGWQDIRTALHRATRSEMKFMMVEGGQLPGNLRSQLFEISADWSARKRLPTMGFTLGTTADVDDPNVNVAIALDASGRVHGFTDWLPVFARRGWVIDLMRRRTDAMVSVMDFIIGRSLMAFKERGYETASLAAAPLANVDRDASSSPLQKALGQVFDHFETYYDFRSLYRYKEKFHPRWESVYLAYRGLPILPVASSAILKAHLPDLNLLDAVRILGSATAARVFPRFPGATRP